ncbi:raffinose/stachyose/melibiose transport system substrate-binding protein [Gracilibacillus orientalis]|uniref:Raffinose/stachyose/melibiose transport system substrate-binding protein n=1 Tax=Gracilibacillus orientalis TaxID=334253 RepID=A0A1I4NTJ0_9BACI|nr:ABC transporter substrate-binding protein [Gracilibacillus orientalis]SFM18607.1 raffinose/stachyose/melibiose transport system substrate-binding protein [Gracilibacillus orientalis]
MKTFFKSFLFMTCISFLLIGCSDGGSSDKGGNNGSEDGITLSLYSTVTNEADQTAMESVIKQFEEEYPDINIDYNFPAGEYESQLRVKMAANDMPDLFDTHGWSQNRYGEYTMDLSDMDWVADLDPALEQIFMDEEGKVYAYPINQAKDGLTYNKNVLDEFGIEPPSTFDELMTALETIKEESNGEVIPLWFGGSEEGEFGQFFDQFATPLLITHPDHDYSEALLDGSFDWKPYTFLPEKLLEMQEKELINVDALTAQVHQKTQLLAQDKIAFVMATTPIGAVRELNPDAELGVMPVPAIHEGGEQSWIGGERHTYAIWKDTEYPEEAKTFIEFLAQPEIVQELAEGTSLPAGLTNASADIYFQPYYDEYADVMVEPYFDRVYLPSGMWEPMGTVGQELLSGSLTPEEVSEKMATEYTRLLEQEGSE